MRGQDDVVHLLERAVVGLLGEAVEGRARQMPGGEQAEEGFFVDEAAAGDVQDDAAGAHQGEAAKIEQRGAVFGLGAMQGDDVRPAHQVVKLKARIAGDFGKGIVVADVHAERFEEVRHGLADLAEAHDAHVLAVQEVAHALLPDAGAQFAVLMRHLAEQGEDETQCQLRDSQRGAVRRIADFNALFGGVGAVHVVHARAAARYDLEVGQGVHDLFGERFGSGGDPVAAFQYLDGFLFRQGAALIVHDVFDARLFEQLQRLVAVSGERRCGDGDFHGETSFWLDGKRRSGVRGDVGQSILATAADDARGNAAHDGVGLHVARDHSARPDHGPVPDAGSGGDGAVRRDPDVILDDYFSVQVTL